MNRRSFLALVGAGLVAAGAKLGLSALEARYVDLGVEQGPHRWEFVGCHFDLRDRTVLLREPRDYIRTGSGKLFLGPMLLMPRQYGGDGVAANVGAA